MDNPRKAQPVKRAVAPLSGQERAARRALGNRLRELRLERDLSQERLADLALLHRNMIGKYERGDSEIGLDALTRIADALGIEPVTLFESWNEG